MSFNSHEPIFYSQQNKCLNWEILQFGAQNELVSNVMPAAGLIRDRDMFEDIWPSRLRVSGVLVFEFSPILAWYHQLFQQPKSWWSSLTYFLFDDASVVFCRWKIWPAGRPIQRPDSYTLIAAVCGFTLSCWKTQCLPWNRRHLEGGMCCSKPLYAFIFQNS